MQFSDFAGGRVAGGRIMTNKTFSALTSVVGIMLRLDTATPILRKFVDEQVASYVQTRVVPALAGLRDDALLVELQRRWDHHRLMCEWLRRLFRSLDEEQVLKENLRQRSLTSGACMQRKKPNQAHARAFSAGRAHALAALGPSFPCPTPFLSRPFPFPLLFPSAEFIHMFHRLVFSSSSSTDFGPRLRALIARVRAAAMSAHDTAEGVAAGGAGASAVSAAREAAAAAARTVASEGASVVRGVVNLVLVMNSCMAVQYIKSTAQVDEISRSAGTALKDSDAYVTTIETPFLADSVEFYRAQAAEAATLPAAAALSKLRMLLATERDICGAMHKRTHGHLWLAFDSALTTALASAIIDNEEGGLHAALRRACWSADAASAAAGAGASRDEVRGLADVDSMHWLLCTTACYPHGGEAWTTHRTSGHVASADCLGCRAEKRSLVFAASLKAFLTAWTGKLWEARVGRIGEALEDMRRKREAAAAAKAAAAGAGGAGAGGAASGARPAPGSRSSPAAGAAVSAGAAAAGASEAADGPAAATADGAAGGAAAAPRAAAADETAAADAAVEGESGAGAGAGAARAAASPFASAGAGTAAAAAPPKPGPPAPAAAAAADRTDIQFTHAVVHQFARLHGMLSHKVCVCAVGECAAKPDGITRRAACRVPAGPQLHEDAISRSAVNTVFAGLLNRAFPEEIARANPPSMPFLNNISALVAYMDSVLQGRRVAEYKDEDVRAVALAAVHLFPLLAEKDAFAMAYKSALAKRLFAKFAAARDTAAAGAKFFPDAEREVISELKRQEKTPVISSLEQMLHQREKVERDTPTAEQIAAMGDGPGPAATTAAGAAGAARQTLSLRQQTVDRGVIAAFRAAKAAAEAYNAANGTAVPLPEVHLFAKHDWPGPQELQRFLPAQPLPTPLDAILGAFTSEFCRSRSGGLGRQLEMLWQHGSIALTYRPAPVPAAAAAGGAGAASAPGAASAASAATAGGKAPVRRVYEVNAQPLVALALLRLGDSATGTATVSELKTTMGLAAETAGESARRALGCLLGAADPSHLARATAKVPPLVRVSKFGGQRVPQGRAIQPSGLKDEDELSLDPAFASPIVAFSLARGDLDVTKAVDESKLREWRACVIEAAIVRLAKSRREISYGAALTTDIIE